MVSKCRGTAEVSLMEVSQPAGIRTRTAALSMADHHDSSLLSIKRRKVTDTTTTTMPEQNSGRLIAEEDNSSSDQALVSCCSSNGSTSKKSMDPEDEREAAGSMSTFTGDGERESNSNLSELEEESMNSTGDHPSDAGSSQETNKKASAVQKPTKVELDEFFAEYEIAMKGKLNEITEKYNFNFLEEKPLVGLYDWVSLKP